MSTAAVSVQDSDSLSIQVSQASSTFVRASLYPVSVTMLGKIAPEWEIIQPLQLSVERDEDGSYLASDDIFFMYGQGVTAVECVRDYLNSLVEYYHILSQHEDEPTQALFRRLQEYLQSVRG